MNACCLSDCLDEKTLNEITPIILKDYPNTYTFTKVLAEDVVKNAGQDLPIVILRPGIGKFISFHISLLKGGFQFFGVSLGYLSVCWTEYSCFNICELLK